MSKHTLLLGMIVILSMYSCVSLKTPSQSPIGPEVQTASESDTEISSAEFIPYLHLEKKISDVVRTIFQDSKGNIWFGTQNGAFCYDGSTLSIVNTIQSQFGQNVTIKDITEDGNGNIWFGHTDGISVIDPEKRTTNYYESDGLLSNDVWCILADYKNQIWIGTINGVCKFDGYTFEEFAIPESEIDTTKGVSSSKMIHDIMQDSKNRLWFSTNGGVYVQNADSLSNISIKNGLKSNFINQVVEDQNGNYWISSSKGLFLLEGESLIDKTAQFFNDHRGTGSILEDSKGNIWFNASQKVYKVQGEEYTEFQVQDGKKDLLPFFIYEDQQNRIWFVGFGGAFRKDQEKFTFITKDGPF